MRPRAPHAAVLSDTTSTEEIIGTLRALVSGVLTVEVVLTMLPIARARHLKDRAGSSPPLSRGS